MDSSALYIEIKSLMQIIVKKKVSLKTHFAITKLKTLKSVQNLGSNLTNQQMAKVPERFATPRTLLGFQFC